MGNRRGQWTEFAVIWSLDKTGDFTIGVYNAGEWKHGKEKGHAGMFQTVRWTHVKLLNLLTFKWGVELGNVVQRMRRGYWGRAAMRHIVACAQTAERPGSQQHTTRDQHEWAVTSSPQVCVASCVRRNFHFYCLALSILILVQYPFRVGLFNDGINWWQCLQSSFMMITARRVTFVRATEVAQFEV